MLPGLILLFWRTSGGPTRVDDTDAWQQPRVVSHVLNRQPITDTDDAAPLGGLRVEEEYWITDQRIRLIANTQQTLWDEERGTPPVVVVDDDYWIRPSVVPLVVNRQPLIDQDERNFTVGSYGGGFGRVVVRSIVRLVPVFTDDEQLAAAVVTVVGEDDNLDLRPQSKVTSKQVFTDNDDAAPLGGFRLDEDYWLQPIYIPYVVNRQPIHDADELGTAVSEKGSGGYGRVVVKPTSRRPQIFLDSDELAIAAANVVDDEYWQQTKYLFPSINPQPNAIEDDWVPQPVAFGLDDDYWACTRSNEFKPPLLSNIDQDELFFAPSPFFLDDEYWNVPGTRVLQMFMPVARVMPTSDDGDRVDFVPPPSEGIYRPTFRPRRR